ncbi:MAG: hypothetical protein JW709_04765, partial [Sedimentisphaerales bacterium]|nr:hypothetical protein [Sedimentisphaerales bacterium]
MKFSILTFLAFIFLFALAVQGELILYYPFEEGSGSVTADASGHGLNGILTKNSGAAPSWITGIEGSALEFGISSVDNNFVITEYDPLLDLTNKWSFTAWVRIDHHDEYHGKYGGLFFCENYTVQVGTDGDEQMYFWPSDETSAWQFGMGVEPPLGQWHHLAFTY